jgi:subtilisin family serine protease
MLPLRAVATEIAIRVTGEREQPLGKATVVLYGEGLPAQALTDDSGVARVTYFGGPVESVQALCINPVANHWDRFIYAPRLNTSGVNTVSVRPLSELFPGFPNERLTGWGQRLMHLDQSGGRLTGSGVRIGIIDSGCDNSHPQLRHVTHGRDFTESASESSWTDDVISHGTHCAGIIAAASTGQGIVGFAPEAQIHVLKVLPGGRVSDLLAALDECIEQELDIVNISAVSTEMSELVAQKLQEARQKGIACIAAAGNWGGAVGFPALLPSVMAVAAVGRMREFPSDSCHIFSVISHLIGADGVFATSFSSAGPQIALSAPGVAVVSTVPGGGYAPSDGTSVAAAHVTGLAALVLAHHPLFQEGPYRMRSEQRVQALLSMVQASALPHFADAQRGGAGVPDLQRIPAEQTQAIPAWPGMMSAVPPPAFGPMFGVSNNWQILMQMRAAGLV